MSVEVEDPAESLSLDRRGVARGLALVCVDQHSLVEEVIAADSHIRLRTDPERTGASAMNPNTPNIRPTTTCPLV